jgi:murein tripeptide amidase MpaA
MGNPWDVTPWPKVGNAGHDELFLAVGKALSNWELVENAIAGLFTRVTVGSYYAPTAPAIRAYSAVTNASNRIQMVRAALESWLHVWKDCPCGRNALDILKECGEWAGRRNDIAHGIVDRVVDAPKHGWFLFPSFYNAKKRPLDDRPAYRYTAANIEYYSDRFEDLHNRLNEVSSILGEWHRIAASNIASQALSKDGGA